METAWMNSDYWNNQNDYLYQDVWCICNTKLPSLYRLILHFSYIYDNCQECSEFKYNYRCRKHIYEYDDEDKDKLNLENEDSEEVEIQIKNIIKKNPKLLYIKFMNFTPLELINKLDKILDIEDTHPFLKYREHCQIRANQHCLYEIKKYAEFEYLKYELYKNIAFRDIQKLNNVGHNASLLQLPLRIWKYIFTFI